MIKSVLLYLTCTFCPCSYSFQFGFQLKTTLLNFAHCYRKSRITSCYFKKAKVRVRMSRGPSQPPDISVVFFDVMDTLVKDPFHQGMHRVFGFDSFDEFVSATDHQTWLNFELGRLNEEEVARQFFKNPSYTTQFDWKRLKAFLWEHYIWMDGIEMILKALQEGEGTIQLHVLSNYPPLYRMIEEKLELSKYLQWSFVSCDIGFRKPDWKIFQFAVNTLGVSPQHCLFVDDRKVNCDAAKQLGFHTIHFQDSQKLKNQLTTYFQWFKCSKA
ncbi:hypothetical protein GpartN1_g2320.t1 [Galdieria partita]|uniref:Uncharacterized protein n=1 Tax=Galdieria partita TaxID=83374 RepID=A0A9C7PU48_9RHOD|nr:hypothetical protein GpartN1_g2320.t1 [Galdieria partita]